MGGIGNTDAVWKAMSFDELEDGGYLDEDGWPTEIPSEVSAISTTLLSDLPPENTSMAGRYYVNYEGEGNVEIRGSEIDGRARIDVPRARPRISVAGLPGTSLVVARINGGSPCCSGRGAGPAGARARRSTAG